MSQPNSTLVYVCWIWHIADKILALLTSPPVLSLHKLNIEDNPKNDTNLKIWDDPKNEDN